MRDLIIVGTGPAGITAAIYAKRAGLDVLVIGKEGVGGQIALSELVENYPGIPSVSGYELMERFKEQAFSLEVEIENREVFKIEKAEDHFTLETADTVLESRSVIIATGAYPRKLGVEGEERFVGRGVSYCATCDGPFFKDLEIAVVGGGDTAIKEALYLSKIAKKVYIIHRRDCLRAEKINQKRIFAAKNVEIIWNSVVEEIVGDIGVDSVRIKNVVSRTTSELKNIQGVFIFIGILPSTKFIEIEKDESGFILTDQEMRTSVAGLFAAGDCRSKRLRQVATAVGDGATAAIQAKDYLDSLK